MTSDNNSNNWKKNLSDEQYKVMIQKGTEAPWTGKYIHENSSGIYVCSACGNHLFDSSTKFDSSTGWPSFDSVIDGSVEYLSDESHGMIRTKIICSKCKSHLGHVFDDGPTKTGKRYCLNSICLDLQKNQPE